LTGIEPFVSEDRREAYYHERVRESGPQYKGFDLLSVEIALGFIHTYEVFNQAIARYMSEYGLSKSSLNVLMLLRHGPAQGMQLHELGELLLVTRANMTGLIDHLEEKGYVNRVVDAHDRRARYARITEKAEKLLDEFMPVHFRNIKALLQDLTTGEKEMLLTLLRRTRSSLIAHSEDQVIQESVACRAAQD
jgi:MarR family transcriptional regulator, 2-MHQ and catechol-resistance regulon repressor